MAVLVTLAGLAIGVYLFTNSPAGDDPDTDDPRSPTPTLPPSGPLSQLVYIESTSPANREDSVAVTRETIIRFNGPVDPISITPGAVTAKSGEQTLDFRLHTAKDRRSLTLFYQESLPADARVRVTIDGNGIRDDRGEFIDPDGDGLAGGTATIDFDTLTLTNLEGTSVCGRVFASGLAPGERDTSVNAQLEGVTITVDGREDELKAITDKMDNFCLDPSPAGRFFVHIDGCSATNDIPEGAYYPFVGKAWDSVSGQQTSVGNVYLPLVAPGTLQPVSQTEDTMIAFSAELLTEYPELEGTLIQVPADSLYADDGRCGGMVGIAPVPPDRLPGSLPPGLDFPIVITVQTDGATNFDEPVPACFPNLPDRTTGKKLETGSKSALWSFNHDTGSFEVVGPMTVDPQGRLVYTDPGVGILAPGWNGSSFSSILGAITANFGSPACWLSIGFGALDCAMSFVPFGRALPVLGGLSGSQQTCGFNAAYRTFAFERDLITASAIGSAEDVVISFITNSAGATASCVTLALERLPYLGSAIACGSAAVGIFRSCFSTSSNNPQLGVGPRLALAAPSSAEYTRQARSVELDSAVRFEAHLNILAASVRYHEILLGSPIWLNLDLTSGDPRIAASQVDEILVQTAASLAADSDGGTLITDVEMAAIKSLDRPSEIGEGDVEALIHYMNRTVQSWSQGILTHDEAQRRDFIDREQLLDSLDQLELTVRELQSLGAEEVDFSIAFSDFYQQFFGELRDPTRSPEMSNILYVLTDETNQSVQRGKMRGGRTLSLGWCERECVLPGGFP
jgi:hypothetical protein